MRRSPNFSQILPSYFLFSVLSALSAVSSYLLFSCTQVEGRDRLVVWGLRTESEWDRGTQVITEIFEKRHNIEVATFSPGSSDAAKLISAIVGGAAPDLLCLFAEPMDWAARGALLPLDDLIERDRETPYGIHVEEYYPPSLDQARFRGHIYALPDWAIGFALYYNKDIFKEAGLVDETGNPLPPGTWEEWFQYNQRLTRRDTNGNIVRLGAYPGYYIPSLFTLGTQMGGRFIGEDGRRCTMDDPAVTEALRWIVGVYDYFGGRQRLEAFRSSVQFSGKDPLFVGGEAMRVEGQWYITNLARFGPDVNYAVAPIPYPAGYPRVDFQFTLSWGIPVGSKKPDLAWEFMKWSLSPEAQEIKVRETIEFTKNRGHPFTPFTTANRKINRLIEEKYIRENPVFPEKTRQAYHVFVEILETATNFRPATTPIGQLMFDELARISDLASWHRMTPEEALADGGERIQKALDQVWGEEQLPLLDWRWPWLFWTVVVMLFASWAGYRLRQSIGRMGQQRRQEALAGMLCVTPWVAGFLVLMAGPVMFSIVLSFTRYSVLRPARWVGLDNYITLLMNDPLFWKSLLNTLFMTIGIPAGMAVSLGLAVLLNRDIRGIAVYRTTYYLPSIVPAVASAILWVWIFHPTSGLMNTFLKWFHVEGPLWLQSEQWAKPAIIINGLWGAGSGIIIWLAGLKGIPEHLYEAAEIDGAGRWTKFRYVTLPMLTPYIFFNMVMGTIGTLQIFTQAVVMTRGGPLDATLFYAYYLFNNAFSYFKMGYASAMAWILFVIIFTLTLIQMKVAPRWVYYEGETK
jgi:multiple sugar transport system permease protein